MVFKAFSLSNPSAFEIVMEATGYYWLSVYSFLFEKGFLLYVINPIQMDGVEVSKYADVKMASLALFSSLTWSAMDSL